MHKPKSFFLSIVFIQMLLACTLIGCTQASPHPQTPSDCVQTSTPSSANPPLSLWTADAPAKKALVDYIQRITTPGSQFIPVQDRIAVFDLDGTLFCETDPNYLDYNMYVYRVLEDPNYKDKATQSQIAVANMILQANETGVVPKDLSIAHQTAYMEAFAGMSLADFDNYVRAFKNTPAPGYHGMKRGEAFYKPMLEVVQYLQDNQFTVYIVSGTDRLQVRSAIAGVISVPERQIIGSDSTLIASGQTETESLNLDNLSYFYQSTDTLLRGHQMVVKNIHMNKVSVIAQEIGRQPVLAFGNSTGDASMAQYVITNNPYPSKAFIVLADDAERENGNPEKAQKMQKLCNDYGWIPISMKNDWKTIYGDQVTKK